MLPIVLISCSNDFENLPPEVLIQRLRDSDSKIHMKALRALSKPQRTAFLVAQLNSEDKKIRGSCVHALTLIGDPRSIPEIAKLEHDPDRWVRRWVAFSMRQFDKDPMAETVKNRMKSDPDPSVQSEARGDWF